MGRIGRISQVDFRKKGRILPIGIAVLIVTLLVAVPLLTSSSSPVQAASAQTVNLGNAASFAVLAGSIVTNTGPTTVYGNVGVSPSIGVPPHVTGFPPGIITGGSIHDADSTAALAQADNTAAFNGMVSGINQPCDTTYPGVGKDLVGLTLVPGVYCASAFTLSGTLTLSGSGVWIFKSASTLITSGTANVVGGGSSCNIWWRVVSSATLGVDTSLRGNILASTMIALATHATLDGRALAQTGAVTMDSNTINMSACGSTTTSTTSSTTSQSSTSGSSSTTSTSTSTTTTSTIPSTVYLTVKSSGSHFVDIWANGVMTSSGFTNASLAVTAGQTFTVGAFDNGCYRFSHWTDGSTQRFLNMSITANTTVTAVYSNICLPLPAGDSSINITTVDGSGSAISGLYATLWENGALNQSCFSPCSFAVAPGTYQVTVDGFGGWSFSHWTDGSGLALRTVVVGSSSSKINLTAVFTDPPMTASGGASLLSIVSTLSISTIIGSVLAFTYAAAFATKVKPSLRAIGRIGTLLG